MHIQFLVDDLIEHLTPGFNVFMGKSVRTMVPVEAPFPVKQESNMMTQGIAHCLTILPAAYTAWHTNYSHRTPDLTAGWLVFQCPSRGVQHSP
jgi:hypothetical protein